MITREQVADLREGDVVELTRDDWPEGAFVRSPLKSDRDLGRALYALDGFFGVRTVDGQPYKDLATLTVVSRAPRPLYVNHDRTEPTAGDVVQPADSCGVAFRVVSGWIWPNGTSARPGEHGLRLLVDGETGQVVGLPEAWDEGFEAGAEHCATNGRNGIPHDPPRNPYETGQVLP